MVKRLEGQTYEEKSAFDFKHGQQFSVVKTIVAFANTTGGELRLVSFQCTKEKLDSARISDFVNKHVFPSIGELQSEFRADGSCSIHVPPSPSAPHVFSKYQSYKDATGKDISAWQAGQIQVRKSSKTTEALGEDIQRMIAAKVREVLSAVAKSISNFGVKISDEDNAIPLKMGCIPFTQVSHDPIFGTWNRKAHQPAQISASEISSSAFPMMRLALNMSSTSASVSAMSAGLAALKARFTA